MKKAERNQGRDQEMEENNKGRRCREDWEEEEDERRGEDERGGGEREGEGLRG